MLQNILYGLAAVVIGFIALWIYHTIKAMKDPDVKAASDLRMTLSRYYLYKRLYQQHQDAMREYGIHSSEATKIFVNEINPQIPNPNEWRRFCEYQSELLRKEMEKELKW